MKTRHPRTIWSISTHRNRNRLDMNLNNALRTFIAAILIATPALAHGNDRHALIVVMDGLLRDAVTETEMPNLHKLARSGVFFDAHHPMFLSSTEVNGTALATGMYPRSSGVMANKEYRPDVELLRPVDTQGQWAQWK